LHELPQEHPAVLQTSLFLDLIDPTKTPQRGVASRVNRWSSQNR
jgi:hypothetical protein